MEIKNEKDYKKLIKRIIESPTVNGTKEIINLNIEVDRACLYELAYFCYRNNKECFTVKEVEDKIENILQGKTQSFGFTEYNGNDYKNFENVFRKFVVDKDTEKRTRRQFIYYFGEQACMSGIQFIDENIIVTFRSCDIFKKFPLDLLLIKHCLDKYFIKGKVIYCNFGSAHIYNKDMRR